MKFSQGINNKYLNPCKGKISEPREKQCNIYHFNVDINAKISPLLYKS